MTNQARYNAIVRMLDLVSIVTYDRINTRGTAHVAALKNVYYRLCEVAAKWELVDGVDRYAV